MMNNAIGMQNSLENILSVFKGIIRSKIFDAFGKLSFNNFCKIKVLRGKSMVNRKVKVNGQLPVMMSAVWRKLMTLTR